MTKKGTQKISFRATRVVKRKEKVNFFTKDGKSVSFKANRDVPKSVKVEFYAKKRK